jgi:hypothetical protein
MQIQVESTTKIVDLNGVPARVWEGHTSSGIPIHCFITRIAVEHVQDSSQFDEELQSCRPPSFAVEAIPLRMIL